jgi:hypothetical protein
VADLAVLAPVLGRPWRVRSFLESLAPTVPQGTRVVFICDSSDHPQERAIHTLLDDGQFGPLEVLSVKHDGTYAAKIRVGLQVTQEALVFTAADDLEFEDGWLEAAMAYLADGLVHVVGVNDMIDRANEPRFRARVHASHFLMTRAYATQPTVDGQPGPFSLAYHHQFVDDELIATAKARNVYAYAEDAHVPHLHVLTGTAADDETYRLGRARLREDRRIFHSRERLWH